MSHAQIALIGLGTVGTGVVSILQRQREALALRAGAELVLKHVVVRDVAKPRDVTLPAGTLTNDARVVWEDPEVSVVVELMGGTGIAGEIVRAALRAGKSVVTANKALLAESGRELFKLAATHNACLAFDAAVAGGIPIVTNLCQCLSANRIDSINGILNGTCNYILSQMEEEGRSYEAALRDAQARGYAEADPTMDVDGTDTTQKLAILAQLAMQVDVDWREIPRMGIERLEAIDVQAAEELGYAIRLVASAERGEQLGEVSLQVDPLLIPHDHGLAGIDGPDNAILVEGDAVGAMLYRGAGAGRMPTASAVVADILDTVAGRAQLTFKGLCQFEPNGKMTDDDTRAARFYLRLPGVSGSPLAGEVAEVMIEHNVPIASSLQYEGREKDGPAPQVIIMTQKSKPATIATVVAELQSLASLTAPVVLARVAD